MISYIIFPFCVVSTDWRSRRINLLSNLLLWLIMYDFRIWHKLSILMSHLFVIRILRRISILLNLCFLYFFRWTILAQIRFEIAILFYKLSLKICVQILVWCSLDIDYFWSVFVCLPLSGRFQFDRNLRRFWRFDYWFWIHWFHYSFLRFIGIFYQLLWTSSFYRLS